MQLIRVGSENCHPLIVHEATKGICYLLPRSKLGRTFAHHKILWIMWNAARMLFARDANRRSDSGDSENQMFEIFAICGEKYSPFQLSHRHFKMLWRSGSQDSAIAVLKSRCCGVRSGSF